MYSTVYGGRSEMPSSCCCMLCAIRLCYMMDAWTHGCLVAMRCVCDQQLVGDDVVSSGGRLTTGWYGDKS